MVTHTPPPNPAKAAADKAWAEYGQGKVDDAVHDLRAVIKQHDDYADAHYMLGVIYAQAFSGEESKACKEMKRYLELAPNGPNAPMARVSVRNCE